MDMNNTGFATHLIPTSRVDSLEKKIIGLAKRIANGKTQADFQPTITIVKEVIYATNSGYKRPYNPEHEYSKHMKLVSYSWVTVMYQQPRVEGWQLVAVYDWEVNQAGERTCYVSTVPGHMVPPEYREIESGECDHCNTNRRRKQSMLVVDETFTDFKVVGSSCIKDFLGHHSPTSLIDVHRFETTLGSYSDEHYDGYVDEPAIYGLGYLLELVAMFTRKHGFIKSGSWDGYPTRDRMNDYLHPSTDDQIKYIQDNKPAVADKEMSAKTIAWILEQPTDSDFMSNLVKVAKAGAVSWKRFGIVASAVSVYKRGTEKAVEKKVEPVKSNNHIGVPKERLRGVMATVVRVKYSDSGWGDGTTTIITLETGSGDTMVWFAAGYIDDIAKFDIWTFDATVKRHDEYNGINQTVLLRVKYSVAGQPETEEL